MHTYSARVREVRLDSLGEVQAWLDCPPQAVPGPGQYIQARLFSGPQTALAAILFPAGLAERGFWAAAPFPASWLPGADLQVSGPLGKGFHMPSPIRRVALAGLSTHLDHLMPLVEQALADQADVAVFCDLPAPTLPASVEINPLRLLADALAWADYLALEVSLAQVERLSSLLGLRPGFYLPCPGQALILSPMPCSGLADCGACAVLARRGWRQVCSEGPVFQIQELI